LLQRTATISATPVTVPTRPGGTSTDEEHNAALLSVAVTFGEVVSTDEVVRRIDRTDRSGSDTVARV
jgi:hypothetical protein